MPDGRTQPAAHRVGRLRVPKELVQLAEAGHEEERLGLEAPGADALEPLLPPTDGLMPVA